MVHTSEWWIMVNMELSYVMGPPCIIQSSWITSQYWNPWWRLGIFHDLRNTQMGHLGLILTKNLLSKRRKNWIQTQLEFVSYLASFPVHWKEPLVEMWEPPPARPGCACRDHTCWGPKDLQSFQALSMGPLSWLQVLWNDNPKRLGKCMVFSIKITRSLGLPGFCRCPQSNWDSEPPRKAMMWLSPPSPSKHFRTYPSLLLFNPPSWTNPN